MITLTQNQIAIASKISTLKAESGSHSPSIWTIAEKIPELQIHIDACFLSNPYATDLFISYFQKELIDTNKLRDVLEFYPSQNQIIADILAKAIGIESKHIFIANGAIEAIQAVMHNFVKGTIIVPIPTFSSYYEFATSDTQVVYYQLPKEESYALDWEDYARFIHKHKPNSVVLINPNNPNGGYLPYDSLYKLLSEISDVPNVIIDESFIHFAFEDEAYTQISYAKLCKEFSNLIFIKSMSKDFGIAGIRAGYAIMEEKKVAKLLSNGYLWNSNGLNEYFFNLYAREEFRTKYQEVRKLYLAHTQEFFSQLAHISQIKLYPSKANFALVELIDGSKSADFMLHLLIQYGIYTRTCNDKIGLNGEFVRIASRSKQENLAILAALKDIFST